MEPIQKLDKKVKDLAEKNLQWTGEWEITQAPEPIFELQTKYKSISVLNLVVHRESYFIVSEFQSLIEIPRKASTNFAIPSRMTSKKTDFI